LKGAAGNLSATALFTMAQAMEHLATEERFDAFDAAWRQLSLEASHVVDALHQFEPAGS
jgi:hypothetical protein